MSPAYHKICSTCIMDDTVPGITFDASGECNYCKIHWALDKEYPKNEIGKQKFNTIIKKIKKAGTGKKYDCIIGVSGGTDSCYLLHLANQHGLKPLAVNLDNGWNSEIAVNNIKKCTAKLNIDLRTYVVDWEEMKDIQIAFLKASLPWADCPTDIAITSSLYKIAAEENIKYILVGADFRTEGKQPSEWTYGDGKLIRFIHKKFGHLRMKTFPNLEIFDLIYYGFLKGIKNLRPLYYLNYNKDTARTLLERLYDWQYYGGHHLESIYTHFILTYWLPVKFEIDKRKVTFSAQIRSGHRNREEALKELQQAGRDFKNDQEMIGYVIKKLGLTPKEFTMIMMTPNRAISEYPSYYPLMKSCSPIVKRMLKFALPWTPTTINESELRKIST